jgi:hypothetical protein
MVVATTPEDERELRIPLLWRGGRRRRTGWFREKHKTPHLVSEDPDHPALRAPLQGRGITPPFGYSSKGGEFVKWSLRVNLLSGAVFSHQSSRSRRSLASERPTLIEKK